MKLNLDIGAPSPSGWINAVLEDFNSFLQDHADCERKASATAMSLVAKYPNRVEIIPELIETALEELEHFQQVYAIMQSRGLTLAHSIHEDLYIKALMKAQHDGLEERFLDRLLIASVVETRGAERFRIVADHMEDDQLKSFYKMLWISEAKHGHVYVKMALHYFEEKKVYERLQWWVDKEATIINEIPLRPALH
ncbi:MAG: tRNA-(ms[2]io[6]A)-hydroxylase [Saprospiraceae bacterium]